MIDVSTALLHENIGQEGFVKLDEETLKLIKDANIQGMQPIDESKCYRVEKAKYGHRKVPKL